MKYFCAFLLLISPFVWSQEFDIEGSVEVTAIGFSEEENPFWFHTNNNYSVAEKTNLSVTADVFARYHFSKFSLNSGVSVFGRDGVPNSIQRENLFIELENTWFFATIGAKKQTVVADGLSSTNKNFLWSSNARPLPGLIIEANNPIKISKTFGLDWGIAHYQLNDDRFVDDTRVHYKRLALITHFNKNHKLTAKIQHFAQWGGKSPVYGELKSDIKDFFYVFTASKAKEIGLDDEIQNAVGNHLGSYMLDYEFKNKWGQFSVYHEHPFEDGSGTRLANFPDGLWGIYFKPKKQRIISSILYEYTDTADQSGQYSEGGIDGYFGNSIYRSGWTYEQNVIGTPFIFTDKDIEITSENTPFINNRSKVHHLGVSGNLKNISWMLKTTYARYLGTYRKPFFPEQKYWYNYASATYKTDKLGAFTLMGGVDFSNVESTIFGGGLTYQYTF